MLKICCLAPDYSLRQRPKRSLIDFKQPPGLTKSQGAVFAETAGIVISFWGLSSFWGHSQKPDDRP